ncbi:MAG: hypothetical protein M3O46_05260 [Myxococcota bacterium]|nr:hypothetical protein [Myxococcota bacterium]
MHALGHALVALVAGAIAVALAQRWGVHASNTFPSLPGLPALRGLRVAGLKSGDTVADEALYWSLVGLAVVSLKCATGVYATYVQGRVAGHVGAALRLELLDRLLAVHRLRRPRHEDQATADTSTITQGAFALTDRVHEVELGLQHGLLGGARAAAQLVPLAAVLLVLSPRIAAVAALVLTAFGALLGRLRSGYQRAAAAAGRN